MNEVYRRKPAPPDWPRPNGIVARQVDRATGQLLATEYCGRRRIVTEYFIAGTEPIATCVPSGPYSPTPGVLSRAPAPWTRRSASPAPHHACRRVPAADACAHRSSRRAYHAARPHPRASRPTSLARLRHAPPARRRDIPPARPVRRSPTPALRRPRDTSNLFDSRAQRDDLAARRLPRPLHHLRRGADGRRRSCSRRARSACVRASPTTSPATSPTALGSPRGVARYLDDLERATTCSASGEFCWHDALWRELPRDAGGALHAPRRLAARRPPRQRRSLVACVPARAPERPHGRRLHATRTSRARGARGEMPVDILAHPTLSAVPLRKLAARGAVDEAREERAGRALARRHRVRDLQPLPPARAHSCAAPSDRGVRISLGSDGHTVDAGRRRRMAARARAPPGRAATRICTTRARTARSTGAARAA